MLRNSDYKQLVNKFPYEWQEGQFEVGKKQVKILEHNVGNGWIELLLNQVCRVNRRPGQHGLGDGLYTLLGSIYYNTWFIFWMSHFFGSKSLSGGGSLIHLFWTVIIFLESIALKNCFVSMICMLKRMGYA